MPIEALVLDGKGEFKLTGKLGDVMRESAQIALSVARKRMGAFGVAADFLEKHDLHVHVPEGAVPKDGPSAGVALACAILSAVANVPARADVAMTGELTLLGDVLPIGGVKEKLLAAYRAGVTEILLPRENERDLEKIDADIRAKLHITLLDRCGRGGGAGVAAASGNEGGRMMTIRSAKFVLPSTDCAPSPGRACRRSPWRASPTWASPR